MKKKILLIPLALLLAVSLIAIGCAAPAPEPEKEFPNKPVKLVVPWSAGGSTDMSQRIVGSMILEHLGQPLVVINRVGGSGVPGMHEITQAEPDGYTIGALWYGALALRPHVVDVPYELDDFEYLLGMVQQRMALLVCADSPFQTLDDLIKAAKARPGELTWSMAGAGNHTHFIGQYFSNVAGIDTRPIPFEGGRPAIVAMLGGHVDYNVGQPSEATSEIEAGKIRILCYFEEERLSYYPDVPTAIELGYDVRIPNVLIIVSPAGVPKDRIKVIHDAYKKVMESEDFQKICGNLHLELSYVTGEKVGVEVRKAYDVFAELAPQVLK